MAPSYPAPPAGENLTRLARLRPLSPARLLPHPLTSGRFKPSVSALSTLEANGYAVACRVSRSRTTDEIFIPSHCLIAPVARPHPTSSADEHEVAPLIAPPDIIATLKSSQPLNRQLVVSG